MIAGIVRSISAAVLLVSALCLLGCGSTTKFQGTWTGNRNLPVKDGENPYLINTLGQVEITINSSQFTMKETGIPYTGTVRYENDKAYLKVETRFGTPITREPVEVQNQMKELILTPLPNEKLSYLDPSGNFPEPLTLDRKPRTLK